MATYTRKDATVEAIQHPGPDLNVTSLLKGDQIAKKGDFLVVDQEAVASLKAQGIESKRGSVYVISKADFLHDFNATDDSVTPVATPGAELTFETLAAPVPAEVTPLPEAAPVEPPPPPPTHE